MDRRKFLRNSTLASLAFAFGTYGNRTGFSQRVKGEEVLAGNAGAAQSPNVSIVLHGLMFYRFVPAAGNLQNLQILIPTVIGHCYLWGSTAGKSRSQLQCLDSFPDLTNQSDLIRGEANFPTEVPSFPLKSRNYDLGEIKRPAGTHMITLPRPGKIESLGLQHRRPFAGKISKHITSHDHWPAALCLQYQYSGPGFPAWAPQGKVHIYAQPSTNQGTCNFEHFNAVMVASAQLFTKPHVFDIAIPDNGDCDFDQPEDPAIKCKNSSFEDLADLNQLTGQSPCKICPEDIPRFKVGFTGGPLCTGFFVTPT